MGCICQSVVLRTAVSGVGTGRRISRGPYGSAPKGEGNCAARRARAALAIVGQAIRRIARGGLVGVEPLRRVIGNSQAGLSGRFRGVCQGLVRTSAGQHSGHIVYSDVMVVGTGVLCSPTIPIPTLPRSLNTSGDCGVTRSKFENQSGH